MNDVGAIIKLSDTEWEELNKTIHTTGWFVIQKIYEEYRQAVLRSVEEQGEVTPHTAVMIGEARAYKKAINLPYEKYNSHAGRKK